MTSKKWNWIVKSENYDLYHSTGIINYLLTKYPVEFGICGHKKYTSFNCYIDNELVVVKLKKLSWLRSKILRRNGMIIEIKKAEE